MFCGWKKRVIDKKGRISFGKKVCEELGRIPVIVKRGNKIQIFPEKDVGKFKPSQIFLGKIDNLGRILIPMQVRFFWGKRVIVRGCGDYIEIKPRKKFSYEEITIGEAEKYRGISVVCDGDKKEVRLV